MNEKVLYRELTPEDAPEIAALANDIYKVKKKPEYVEWQCFNNYFPSVVIGGFSGNKLIGMFGIQKKSLSNGAIAGQLSWISVKSEWRGKGVFSNLGKMAIDHFKDLDLIYIFANENARVPCQEAFHMNESGVLTALERSSDSISAAECQYYIAPYTGKDAINEMALSKRVSFTKDREYRKWRYVDNPLNDYFQVTIQTGEFLIFKLFRDSQENQLIADYVEIGCSEYDRLEDLLNSAGVAVRKMNAEKATIWAMPGSELRKTLNELGFKEIGYQCYFLVRVLNASYQPLYDLENWDLSQSDATNY